MRVICSYCEKDLGLKHDESEVISHGICPDCFAHFSTRTSYSLSSFLDTLDCPVLVVSRDRRVIEGNQAIKKFLKDMESSWEEKQFLRGGEFFECSYSRRRDGCGSDEHCLLCGVKRLVETCHETGESFSRVPAKISRICHDVSFLVSVEKDSDVVLISIEDIQSVPTV